MGHNYQPSSDEVNSDPMASLVIALACELLEDDIHTVGDLREIWLSYGRWECTSIPDIERL